MDLVRRFLRLNTILAGMVLRRLPVAKLLVFLSAGLAMVFLVSCSATCRKSTETVSSRMQNPFFPLCFEISDSRKRSLPEQVTMVRSLGFEGIGYPLWLDDSLDKNLKIIDNAGLGVCMLYTRININPSAGQAYDPRLTNLVSRLKGRSVTICVLLQGLPPADARGEAKAVAILRELGNLASDAGLRISVYHHKNDWTESLLFALKVVEKVNHPDVGVNFNLCHWLMVDGDKDYQPVLRQNSAKIFLVTLNGASMGAKAWTNGLIQPLDQGDFDNGQLLKVLREINYRGPIGLMCYGIPGNALEHLSCSMKAWQKLKAFEDR